MNIFGSKSGHQNNSKKCKIFFIFLQFLHYLFIYFSEFCSAFATLHFEKSLNTAKGLEKIKKILSIILLIIWLLLKPKMFIVQWRLTGKNYVFLKQHGFRILNIHVFFSAQKQFILKNPCIISVIKRTATLHQA